MDAKEDKAFGCDKSGEEMPDWVADKTRRAETIRAAQAELEVEAKAAAAAKAKAQAKAADERKAEGRKKPGKPAAPPSDEPDAKAQKNPRARPGGRIMKTKDGFVQGYNAQAAVDATAQVIVAHGLDARQSDQHQLTPIADAIEANLGRKPTQLSADAGYCSDANLAALEERGIDAYVAPGRAPNMRAREKAAARASPPCARKSRPGATTALSLEEATARAGVRTDQASARLSSVPAARGGESRRRMGFVCIAHNILKLAQGWPPSIANAAAA